MRIQIRVTIRSKRPGIRQISGKEFRVAVSSIPEKGEANGELIQILADHFGIPKSKVSVVRGSSARTKVVDIDQT